MSNVQTSIKSKCLLLLVLAAAICVPPTPTNMVAKSPDQVAGRGQKVSAQSTPPQDQAQLADKVGGDHRTWAR